MAGGCRSARQLAMGGSDTCSKSDLTVRETASRYTAYKLTPALSERWETYKEWKAAPEGVAAFFVVQEVVMGMCAVYLDAGYIEKVLQYEHPGRRIDYGKLATEMSGSDELLRAHYYNCLPYQSNPPTVEEKDRYDKKYRFIDALNYVARFHVRLGQLALVGVDANGKKLFQQKRVDLMLGVDMALLAGKGKITSVALFSGDSDTIPAVEAVKQEGVLVTLWHGALRGDQSPSRELYKLCDERVELSPEIMGRIARVDP